MKTSTVTQASINVEIYKDGKVMENKEGVSDIGDLVMSFSVEEGIDLAAMTAELVLQDAAGVIDRLSGAETWKIKLKARDSNNIYTFQAYNIEARSRQGSAEGYIVQLVSYEFILNEAKLLFGHTDVLFNKKTKANEMVEEILTGQVTGGPMTKKKLYAEETQNELPFICPNWRPFDTIYFAANRSIRKSSAGKESQNGFIFWENIMGYHFKSIDQIIADINDQAEDGESDVANGEAKLYTYAYQPKKMETDGPADGYRIDSITFPDDRNFLGAMRDGSYSGFSTALDPTKFGNSKLSAESKNSEGPGSYDLEDFWGKMEHLDNGKCPITDTPDQMKQLLKSKRRIRYTVLPNRLFDPKGQSQEQSENTQNLDELAYLESYKNLRASSLKAIKLIIAIPGNLDLYSGYGINIKMPKTKQEKGAINTNKRYSGRYCIASIKQSYADGNLYTEMLLYKDSLPN